MAVAAMPPLSAPIEGYWARWEQRSSGWKAAIEFLHPFGRDHAEAFAPLDPLFAALRALPGVEVVPVEFLHATWLHIGFLSADDVMWSQVDTFYVGAAPRLRRVEPRAVRLGGIVLTDGRVTLRIEDDGLFREARRQAALGVPRAQQALDADPAMSSGDDTYSPSIDLAYLDGSASAESVEQVIEAHREARLSDVTPTHLMLARRSALPERHFDSLDIVAEVPMLGAQHRGGYHN